MWNIYILNQKRFLRKLKKKIINGGYASYKNFKDIE